MGAEDEDGVASGFGADRGESGRPSLLDWLFIDGNRLVVTAGLTGLTYLVLLAANALIGPIAREETSPIFYLFSALVGGNFTLITIVISVSQLVVSRQLGTPGQIRDQIESTNNFRESIEETSDIDVAPVTPTEFLHILLQSAAELTRTVTQEIEQSEGDPWEELTDAVDQLAAHVGRVEKQISKSDVTVVSALAVTLDTNYSADIYQLRSIRAQYGEELSEEVMDCLDTLVVRLQQIDIGRQYMKTLYMQDELSKLSRSLLYVGVPALLVSVYMLRAFAVGFETLSPDVLFAFVPLAITISLAPLLVLVAYILRLTTVARRTIAITPFTMAMQERDESILGRLD